jgi:DNA-binding transcriptional LysR family regulator
MDWNDLKIILAIARTCSVRGAAKELNVSQSTISRRINAFEKAVGTTLFNKLPSGYEITPAGLEIQENAERIEKEIAYVNRCLFKQNPILSGTLRVAIPPLLSTAMFMPDFVNFCDKYPDIKLDLAVSESQVNLSKREADVAIRVMMHGNSPPPYLVCLKTIPLAVTGYMAKDQKDQINKWIGDVNIDLHSQWMTKEEMVKHESRSTMDHIMTKVVAVKEGMGMAILPCFIADKDEGLVRIPPEKTFSIAHICLLSHSDLKNTPKVRVFIDFMKTAFEQKRSLCIGDCLAD